MEKFQKTLTRLPSWILTISTTLLILWLTLAPDPLGEDSPRLFPGADKVLHALMFGFLTMMILLDRVRRKGWMPLRLPSVAGAALASAVLGGLVEVAQLEMQMGRGFEWADILADTIGAATAAAGWSFIQDRLERR